MERRGISSVQEMEKPESSRLLEAWLTNRAVSKQLGRTWEVVKRVADKYRATHPEWFRDMDVNGGTFEHYSPGLVVEVITVLQNVPVRRLQRRSEDQIHWSKVDPEQRKQLVEEKAREYVRNGRPLKSSGVQEAKEYQLHFGISQYYSGGYPALRERLNLEGERQQRIYKWKSSGMNQEQIIQTVEEEVKKYLENGGVLTYSALEEADLGYLRYAIKRYIPGNISALKDKFSNTAALSDYKRKNLNGSDIPKKVDLGEIQQLLLSLPQEQRREIADAFAEYIKDPNATMLLHEFALDYLRRNF